MKPAMSLLTERMLLNLEKKKKEVSQTIFSIYDTQIYSHGQRAGPWPCLPEELQP